MRSTSIYLPIIACTFLLFGCSSGNNNEESDVDKKDLKTLSSDRIKAREAITDALKKASFKVLKINIVLGDKISPDNSKGIPNDIEKICTIDEDVCAGKIVPVGTLKRLGVNGQYDLFDLSVPPAGDIERMGGAFKRQVDMYIQSAVVPDSMLIPNPASWKIKEILERQSSSIVDSIFFFSNIPESAESISINNRKYRVFKNPDELKKTITDLVCQADFGSPRSITVLYNIPSKSNIIEKTSPKLITEEPAAPKVANDKPITVRPPFIKPPVAEPAFERKPQRRPKPEKPANYDIPTVVSSNSDDWVVKQLGECANGFREVTEQNIKTGKQRTVKKKYVECDNIEPDWVKKSVNDVKEGQVKKQELGKQQ